MKTENKEVAPFINITPLIDVLLVLLIIFMTISPLKPRQFKTKLSQEPTLENVPPNPYSLVVTIDKDLQIRLNQGENIGSVNSTEKLIATLAQTFRERKETGVYRNNWENLSDAERIEKTVFIKAPRSVGYGEVVKVIDNLKGVGAEPIGLQIDDLSQ
jgi:biopolymer transport protein ExbD